MKEKKMSISVKEKHYPPDLIAMITGAICSAGMALPVLADSGAIISGISNGTQQIWNILVGVVAPIAAVALAICAIKIIWGGQRAAEEAKSTAIKIVIGIAIVLLAPSIVSAVRGWFTASTWNFS